MTRSQYLQDLDQDRRSQLEQRLLARQTRRCFICDEEIDLVLHKGQLDIDHIDPLVNSGLDSEQNFALTHASCNRSKGASNLQVARCLAEFERPLVGRLQTSDRDFMSGSRERWKVMVHRTPRHMRAEGWITHAAGATWHITAEGNRAAQGQPLQRGTKSTAEVE